MEQKEEHLQERHAEMFRLASKRDDEGGCFRANISISAEALSGQYMENLITFTKIDEQTAWHDFGWLYNGANVAWNQIQNQERCS